MRRNLLAILLAIPCISEGQLSISNGKNLMEFSVMVSTFYNHRIYIPGHTNFRKNRFSLRDAQFKVEGRWGNHFEYEFQVDLADITGATTEAEATPIMDANITWKSPLGFRVIAGFQKVPYSFTSLTPFQYMPFSQRPECLRGEVLGRRDMGVTFKNEWWNSRITAMAGAYTGLGNYSLLDNNDPSGTPEVVSRVELAWPAAMDYRMLDHTHSPIPRFAMGLNARYMKKKATFGQEYQLLTVDGTKSANGLDLALHYQGWSALLETHQINIIPADTQRLFGLATQRKSFLAGTFTAQTGYYAKKIRTGVFLRYDHYNLNNLYKGETEEISMGIIYLPKGWRTPLKCQIRHIVREEQDPTNPEAVQEYFNYKTQIRLGWTYAF